MAQPDGTYYYPSQDGVRYDVIGPKQMRRDFIVTVSGGSGSAKAYVEAYDGTSWIDVSGVFGAAFYSASSGETRTYQLYDKDWVLSPFKSVRIRIVLDTGGANDGDYSAKHLKMYGR